MGRIFQISLIAISVLFISSCKPVVEPPEVIIVPDPEPTQHYIDQFYYAQFTWGKSTDTITMQEPLDTSSVDTSRFYQNAYELLSLPIVDTTGVDENTLVKDLDTIGWVYGPSAAMVPFRLEEFLRGQSDRTLEQVTRNVFRISFPYTQKNDTVPFWDIQDYLDNPSVVEGSINWGRMGNGNPLDTLWFNDHRDGVMISYTDRNGEVWESDNKPTFQPFGYFQIDSVYANFRDGLSYNIVSGQFAARLYNDVGYFKDMKAGKFRMRILTDITLGPKPE